MERRKHWWNGTWGRLVRRDLYLYEDGNKWTVEARLGESVSLGEIRL